MKYYLHDSNSFSDEKISELFINFGYEGLGLFYTLLEKLAAQEKPIKTNVLKSQLRVGKKLNKCWSFMEEIELISSNNGETFNKQLLNFSGKYAIKKEKNAKRISEWREKQSVVENVTRSEQICNNDKVKESKVNVIKEKEPPFFENSENSIPENEKVITTEDLPIKTKKEKKIKSCAKKEKPEFPKEPFLDTETNEKWQTLISMAKWRKKELSAINEAIKQLKRYDEIFIKSQIGLAIQGSWQGVVFGDTDEKYQIWKNKQNGKTGQNTNSTTDNNAMRKASEGYSTTSF